MVALSTSPRSSTSSEPLSPEQAAASLSWGRNLADVEEDEDELRFGPNDGNEGAITPALVRIAVVAGLGGLLFGFDTGVVSGALLAIGSSLGGRPLTLTQESFLVTSALFGALGGSLLAGRLADRVGRKPVIVGAAVLFTMGALEQAAAQVFKEVVLGRVLVGVGVGLASCVLPTYLAELSPPKFRGRIVASLVVLITGGQLLAYLVDALLISAPSGWRWMFGLGALPALLQLALSFSLPESPRYQLRRGRVAGARKTLKLLNPRKSGAGVQRMIEELQAEVGGEVLEREGEGVGTGTRTSYRSGWRGQMDKVRTERGRMVRLLWEDRANRRALLVATGLQFFQQATGFNCLMYFSAKILHQTHLSAPATFAIFVAVSNFACTLVALRLIDRVGRRTLLLRGLAGMAVGMGVLAGAFGFIPDEDEAEHGAGAAAYVALLGMVGFCCAYALSLGNVPWVVQSEVFNQDLRALGTGLATATNWIANLLVSSTFLHLSRALTPSGAFALYAFIALLGWLFTWRYLPETKGLSLEEVRGVFETEVGVRVREGDGEDAEAGGEGGAYHVVGDEDEAEDEDAVPGGGAAEGLARGG
ncbi:hypothetical protein JCM1840_006509 [Sporobolomyces johnsonii]